MAMAQLPDQLTQMTENLHKVMAGIVFEGSTLKGPRANWRLGTRCEPGALEVLVTLLAVPACVATCVTRWFDRDNPSGVGDFETLVDLRNEYPGLICSQPTGIEAQTLDGAPASSTGQTFNPYNTANGFACVNSQQTSGPCKDYKVRFICPPDFCSGCTTPWFDRDNPSGYGDYETINELRNENPNKICDEPYAIHVQTVTGTPAYQTGQIFAVFDPLKGFACVNEQQPPALNPCLDYKVQFTCPKSFC